MLIIPKLIGHTTYIPITLTRNNMCFVIFHLLFLFIKKNLMLTLNITKYIDFIFKHVMLGYVIIIYVNTPNIFDILIF